MWLVAAVLQLLRRARWALLVPFLVWTYVRAQGRAEAARSSPSSCRTTSPCSRRRCARATASSARSRSSSTTRRSRRSRSSRRVVADEQLGVPLEDALDTVVRADEQPGSRAGRARRRASARDRRQHGRGARPRGRDRSRAAGAAPAGQDADRAGADVSLGRLVTAARAADRHLRS